MRADGNYVFLDPNSPFVGIFENSVYRNERMNIGPGDRLVFYTDGVFELRRERQNYGPGGFPGAIKEIR